MARVLTDLPPELIVELAYNLNENDLLRFSGTCTYIQGILFEHMKLRTVRMNVFSRRLQKVSDNYAYTLLLLHNLGYRSVGK